MAAICAKQTAGVDVSNLPRRVSLRIAKLAGRCLALLARHRDADSVLRRDEVVRVLSGLGYGKLHPLHSAVERVAARAIVRGNGGAGVLADVAAVVG